jgi:hypothetical protein
MKHIDFAGWVVRQQFDGLDFTFPIVRLGADDLEECEVCVDPFDRLKAEYMVDAEAELGEGGYNAFYCQEHLLQLMEIHDIHYGLVTRP